jgi:hypothetical protein
MTSASFQGSNWLAAAMIARTLLLPKGSCASSAIRHKLQCLGYNNALKISAALAVITAHHTPCAAKPRHENVPTQW